ncbi:MAG TPA: DUF1579 domain-containing protein [Planctomycetota bacterium]|nr:DUF1579 domain-containing protein [Planctomycetota bacterium]
MRSAFTILAFAAASALAPLSLRAADAGAAAGADIEKAIAVMTTTGAEHEALKRWIGEWTVESTMYMAPGAPPMISKGTATFSAMLDGRWVRQDYQGDMMGQAFIGFGLSGYDTLEKKYVATWCDSFSTSMAHMVGESDDGGKTITYRNRVEHCPMTGGPLDMRTVVALESADKLICTSHHTPEGGTEALAMELVYTRVAK